MELAQHDYEFLDLLGHGTFGCAYLCKNSKNELVCIKRIRLNNMNMKENVTMIKREAYIMSQLKHPNIIGYKRSFPSYDCINVVMEYATNGSLRDVIKKRTSRFPENTVIALFSDILMGLEYLHIRHVIHRDLKPENVLIGSDGKAKIADFSVSYVHKKSTKTSEQLGTPLYVAPEVLKGSPYDFKADTWSLGCIFYEICTFRNPFEQAKNRKELMDLITNENYSKVGCDMLGILYGLQFKILGEQMLTYNYENRSSVSEIITNPLILIHYYKKYFDYSSSSLTDFTKS